MGMPAGLRLFASRRASAQDSLNSRNGFQGFCVLELMFHGPSSGGSSSEGKNTYFCIYPLRRSAFWLAAEIRYAEMQKCSWSAPKQCVLFARWQRSRLFAPSTPNRIYSLEKSTALREAELLRIEASLAAPPRDEQTLVYRQHPRTWDRPSTSPACPNTNSNCN